MLNILAKPKAKVILKEIKVDKIMIPSIEINEKRKDIIDLEKEDILHIELKGKGKIFEQNLLEKEEIDNIEILNQNRKLKSHKPFKTEHINQIQLDSNKKTKEVINSQKRILETYEIKGKVNNFEKVERTNPQTLELLSTKKKYNINKSNPYYFEFLSSKKDKIIQKNETYNLEILAPKTKKFHKIETESNNFELLNKKKQKVEFQKTQSSYIQLLSPKKEEKLEKTNVLEFELLKNKKVNQFLNLKNENLPFFQIDKTSEIYKKSFDINDEENEKPNKLKSGKNKKERDEDIQMDINKTIKNGIYHLFLLNLSQLFRNKITNYKNKFLTNLKNYENADEKKRKKKEFVIEEIQESFNIENEKPTLRIRKRNLQSLSLNNNNSENYTNILVDYLKKRIALQNWYNKMMALRNSKRIRIVGRKIGEGVERKVLNNIILKKGSFKTNLLRFPFEQIRREAKRRILIKALLNIQKLKYPSLEYGFLKLKKYTEVKLQIMIAYATLIQRYYRFYIECLKQKKKVIEIIEESNTIIETSQKKRIPINYNLKKEQNIQVIFWYFYKKLFVKRIKDIFSFKSYN